MYLQQAKPGIPFVSNRSIIVQKYEPFEKDGAWTMVASSVDSTALYEKYKDKIPKGDVIGTVEVNFWQFKALEKGVRVTHITNMNPNGSLPGAIVKQMTKRQSGAMLDVAEFLRARKK